MGYFLFRKSNEADVSVWNSIEDQSNCIFFIQLETIQIAKMLNQLN